MTFDDIWMVAHFMTHDDIWWHFMTYGDFSWQNHVVLSYVMTCHDKLWNDSIWLREGVWYSSKWYPYDCICKVPVIQFYSTKYTIYDNYTGARNKNMLFFCITQFYRSYWKYAKHVIWIFFKKIYKTIPCKKRYFRLHASYSAYSAVDSQNLEVENSNTTLPQKRNSSPFHLQILKLPDGVQASNRVRWNTYTGQKKFFPIFLNFKLNKRGVSFLSECIVPKFIWIQIWSIVTPPGLKYNINGNTIGRYNFLWFNSQF